MKRLAVIASLLLLTGGGCMLEANNDARVGAVNDLGESTDRSDRTVSGVITAINLDGVAADGPAVVTIKMDAGSSVEIHVPSFGLGLCAAGDNLADVYALKTGDRLEVRGEVSDDGIIVPCQSIEHYLRVK